jgi:hypothetical protein
VASTLTRSPTTKATVKGETVLLETIPEIITKKIYHRGSSIMPRDVFDIAAAGEQHEDSILKELRDYRDEVTRTLATIDKMHAEFVNGAIAQLAINDPYKGLAETALERTRRILRAV